MSNMTTIKVWRKVGALPKIYVTFESSGEIIILLCAWKGVWKSLGEITQ